MTNRLVKRAEYEYLPAIPEVVARPAYCAKEALRYEVIATYGDASSQLELTGWEVHETDPGVNMGVPSHLVIHNYKNHDSAVWYPYVVYRTVYHVVCYPAIEAVPGRDAQFVYDSSLGWQAGARSIDIFAGDVYLTFDVNPDGVGMLCGISPAGSPTADYNAISHGIQMTGDTISIVESGVVLASVPYEHTDRLAVHRVAGRVTYHVGSWRYESPNRISGAILVSACLYAPGDYIDNPRVGSIHTISAESDWGWLDVDTAFALSARSDWGWRAEASIGDGFVHVDIPLDMGASQYPQGYGVLDVGGVGVNANDIPTIAVSGVQPAFPVMLVSQGNSVVVGGVVFDIGEVKSKSSDYLYGEAVFEASTVVVSAVAYDEAPGSGQYADRVLVRDTYTTDPVLYALINETISVGDTIDVLLAMDAGLVEYLIPTDTVTANMLMVAVLSSNLHFSDNTHANRAAVLQYATNLLTGAVGRYEGFDFRGFVKSGMQTFGWKRDGLYRLGYAEDTGEEIQAMIDFAAEDFDTTHRKSIRALFFGVDTDGALYARLVDDNDCAATYRVIPHGDTQRANPAQRPTSRFWRLRLEIVDATFADLDNVEWKAATTGRRTRS